MRNIHDELIWIDNTYITKNGQLGDAMSANAAMALVTPNDERIHNFVNESFVDKRPFRSPFHAKDPKVDLKRSFSRDHVLSLCWYVLWSNRTWPILLISRYASENKLKIGKEGTYSQHGLTPNIMWAMHSVANARKTTVTLPWYYKIWPSWIIALIQLLSAKTVSVGYRLNLCAELALIAKFTGKWNSIWQAVIDTCRHRQPTNLYYDYVSGRVPLSEIDQFLNIYTDAFKMSDKWCWNEMARDDKGRLLACGQDLLLLKALIKEFPNLR